MVSAAACSRFYLLRKAESATVADRRYMANAHNAINAINAHNALQSSGVSRGSGWAMKTRYRVCRTRSAKGFPKPAADGFPLWDPPSFHYGAAGMRCHAKRVKCGVENTEVGRWPGRTFPTLQRKDCAKVSIVPLISTRIFSDRRATVSRTKITKVTLVTEISMRLFSTAEVHPHDSIDYARQTMSELRGWRRMRLESASLNSLKITNCVRGRTPKSWT